MLVVVEICFHTGAFRFNNFQACHVLYYHISLRLKKNFVEKENGCLSKNDMYQSYLEFCSSAATFAMDFIFFHKVIF